MTSPNLVKEFQRILGKEQVFLEETDRATYAYDAAVLEPVLPAIVLRPRFASELGQVVRLCYENDLPIGTFGHAGDGNLHPTILTDRRDRQEWARVEAAVDAIFEKALELGGTLSGEHGIGTAKSRFLEKEFGPGTILFSKKIKAAVDPPTFSIRGKL